MKKIENIDQIDKSEENDKNDKLENNEPLPTSEKENRIIKYLSDKLEILKFTFNLIKQDGFSSLYNGVTSSIFGAVVQYAMYFCSSKFWSYVLDHLGIKIKGIARSMLINLIAAICTAIVTNPIWVLNARMAKKKKEVLLLIINYTCLIIYRKVISAISKWPN